MAVATIIPQQFSKLPASKDLLKRTELSPARNFQQESTENGAPFQRCKDFDAAVQPTDLVTDPHTKEQWPTLTLQIKLFDESKKAFVGHMPVELFFNSFLPWQKHAERIPSHGHFPAATAVEGEYESFISMAHQVGAETLQFVDTRNSFDSKALYGHIRPDMAVYSKRKKVNDIDFSEMETWIEFEAELDPFKEVSGSDLSAIASDNIEEGPTDAEAIVGRLLSIAVAHMGSGFFNHSFSVFIFGDSARLIRWDRAGAIVSEAFDYVHGKQLVEFFLRFDQLSPEQRGRDPTVTSPDDTVRKAAENALKPRRNPGESNEEFSERIESFDPNGFVEYRIHDSDSGETQCFVGPPLARPALSLHGRSTRGTPVYDVVTGAVCYLKDTWRINSDELFVEGKTYELLHKAKVNHVANVVAHGDVPTSDAVSRDVATDDRPMTRYQITRTDLFCQSSDEWCTIRPQLQGYTHYRIVLDTVGREYTTFKSTKELLLVTVDAIRAHGEAYEKAGILHRDISPGNIMITEEGRGFLIDWDLAKSIHGEGAHLPGRTGTWYFLSGQLLLNPETKIHEYSDDLESFLHAMTYTLIRFTKTDYGAKDIRYLIEKWYSDSSVDLTNRRARLATKADKLALSSYIPHDLAFVGRGNLHEGLKQISFMFRRLYWAVIPEVDDEERRKAHTHLNKYKWGGGFEFIDKITETVDVAGESWQDGPAELIPLPPSAARKELDEYVEAIKIQILLRSRKTARDHCHRRERDAEMEPWSKRQRV